MPNSLKVKVVSPSGILFEGESSFTKLPAEGGEIGALPGISPTLAKLMPGSIDIKEKGTTKKFFVRTGVGHLLGDQITILTPFLEASGDIDRSRAEKAMQRAQDRLKSDDTAMNKERARQALLRAEARLRILNG